MFQVNDHVMYSNQGICTVTDICRREINGESISYYVLQPVFDNKSTIFVPCKNAQLTGKMRRVLSVDEVTLLIEDICSSELEWIADDAERKTEYETVIRSGNRKEIALLIKTLYKHKLQRCEHGKKLHAADIKLLDTAQKLLHEELAFVLGISPGEVPEFIQKKTEEKNC